VGAGLQAWEVLEHAERYNVTLVATTAPSCLTVGLYGGWITGGGHSPLSSKFGLGADQVLDLKIVTADGRYVTANPQTNQDLFFAMRGGGGSMFYLPEIRKMLTDRHLRNHHVCRRQGAPPDQSDYCELQLHACRHDIKHSRTQRDRCRD
jgi:FAD/FMN-containing dehydrogenase